MKVRTGRKSESAFSQSKKDSSTDFDRLERILGRHRRTILGGIVLAFVVLAIMMFDVKISTGGDDALYIESGYRYATLGRGYFYSATAPLYPMFLGILVYFVGLNLVVLKASSLILVVVSIVLMYKALAGRTPYLVFFPVLTLYAMNAHVLYFASQTYTEAFYLCLQSGFLLFFVRLLDRLDQPELTRRDHICLWATLGGFLLVLTIARNVALGAVGAVLLYFLIEKKYSFAAYAAGALVGARLLYEGIKRFVWGSVNQYSMQMTILFQKHPYDASQGEDTIIGFFGRLVDNASIYFGNLFFQILGLKAEGTPDQPILALGVVASILAGLVVFRKHKDRLMMFVSLYIISMCGLTFFVLQAFWGQLRFVLIYVPFILLIMTHLVYRWLSQPSRSGFQFTYMLAVAGLMVASLSATIPRASTNTKILAKNLAGDLYFGYTNDWVNYLRMCAWAAESLPDTSLVACRKPDMAFIYGGGKTFHGIYNVPTENPDSIIKRFHEVGVTHVIDANLRSNPTVADGRIITTVRRTILPIMEKYPDKLRLVHTIGETEPAYLFQLNP